MTETQRIFFFSVPRFTADQGHQISVLDSIHKRSKDSAVEIKNVVYQNIAGTSAEEDGVIFECSKKHPCQGIVLQEINLTQEGGDDAKAICNYVDLTYIGTVIPRCPKNIIQINEHSERMVAAD